MRLTGGEPLLRRGLIDLIAELAKLRTIEGRSLDLALTTNGHLLAGQAQRLHDTGLNRVTVSMDAIDADTVERITRIPNSLRHILDGIQAAQSAGFDRVKINCVLLRGFNDDQIFPSARFSREFGVIVRFIEFMPLDEAWSWTIASVVSLSEVTRQLEAFRPLVPLPLTAPRRDSSSLHIRQRTR